MPPSPTPKIRRLEEFLLHGEAIPDFDWELRMITSEECLSYVAWNRKTKEALLVDPKREARDAYGEIIQGLGDYTFLAVIDTHTHADHVSSAADFSTELRAPLIMHERSASRRVHLRVSQETQLHSSASPLRFVPSPGHTDDSLSVLWGPFLFTGDTVLYGDTGRDDLPTGSAEDHFESLQLLRTVMADPSLEMRESTIVLPGHDNHGGRAMSWKKQLELNPSLIQEKADFIRESLDFSAAAPHAMDEAIRLNTE